MNNLDDVIELLELNTKFLKKILKEIKTSKSKAHTIYSNHTGNKYV